MLVGKDAECCGTILLVAQRNDVWPSLLLNPPLRGRAALKLGYDARRGLEQCLAQRGLRGGHTFQFFALGGDDFL
jgi:hypothetical protein